jgi:septal ring factor EnvC (AmiA/AmiB activator)
MSTDVAVEVLQKRIMDERQHLSELHAEIASAAENLEALRQRVVKHQLTIADCRAGIAALQRPRPVTS